MSFNYLYHYEISVKDYNEEYLGDPFKKEFAIHSCLDFLPYFYSVSEKESTYRELRNKANKRKMLQNFLDNFIKSILKLKYRLKYISGSFSQFNGWILASYRESIYLIEMRICEKEVCFIPESEIQEWTKRNLEMLGLTDQSSTKF